MTKQIDLAALSDLRTGVEMDRAYAPDAEAKVAALDRAIALLQGGSVAVAIDGEAVRAAYEAQTGQTLNGQALMAALIEGAAAATMPVAIEPGEVLVALARGEGYEDVHPQLVAEDAIAENWPSYRTITAASA